MSLITDMIPFGGEEPCRQMDHALEPLVHFRRHAKLRLRLLDPSVVRFLILAELLQYMSTAIHVEVPHHRLKVAFDVSIIICFDYGCKDRVSSL